MQTTMLQKFCGWFFLQVRNSKLFLAEFIVLNSDIISNYNNFISEKLGYILTHIILICLSVTGLATKFRFSFLVNLGKLINLILSPVFSWFQRE